MKMIDNEILTRMSPNISHLVVYLIREGFIGICGGQVKAFDLNTSSSTFEAQTAGKCDRFKLVIPYAGQTITWEVLFNCNYPEDAPDFIFGPDDADFFPNIENVKSLVDWDYREPSSLLRVLEELLQEYKRHQVGIVSDSSRLHFEYKSLLEHADVQSDDIEVFVSRHESRVGPIHFLMKLHVDFARIPAYIVKLNPGEDAAILLVTFNSAEGNRITPQLYLSPRVERALGGAASLRIPGFPSNTSLMDYVPSVTELLKYKVDQMALCYEKRKEYLAAFLGHYGRSILEYDAEGFSKISFLFEWNDFFFIVCIELPTYFPKEQPVLTFQSVYHETKGRPYTEVFDDYPYSPRWSGVEMADRARKFILENISAFQMASVNSVLS